MAINLDKGQRVNLSKDNPGLNKIRVGLSWDVKEGVTADLDASVVLTGENEKLIPGNTSDGQPLGLVFYKNLDGTPGVLHTGDNRTGEGDGDDETIKVTLSEIPSEATALLFVISSYSESAPVTFGVVKNPKVTLYDDATGEDLYTFELDEDASTATSVEIARIYRKNSEWRYTSLGDQVGTNKNGLEDIVAKYS